MDTRKRVLIVDDSEEIRDVYEMLLSNAGFEVDTACNGIEGFEHARAKRPDVIILDVVMPGMDGLQLLLNGRGIVVREVFDELLDTELRILDRRGGSLELAVVEVSSLDAGETVLARAPSPGRLMAGVLSQCRVALFKRALDGSAARDIAAVIADLRATEAPRAVGLVDFPAGGVRGFSGGELVHVASIALDRAAESGGGAHRVTIAEERVT